MNKEDVQKYSTFLSCIVYASLAGMPEDHCQMLAHALMNALALTE